jgi:hydrogenase nickel incorporation protein HypB
VYAINIMASPGAGKTSVILKTLETLHGRLRLGVIEGDLATSIDTEKALAAGMPAVQINTGGDCHLDAVMISQVLPSLPLSELDLVIVENVGNLVAQPPGTCSIQATSKSDLLPYLPFVNMDYFKRVET